MVVEDSASSRDLSEGGLVPDKGRGTAQVCLAGPDTLHLSADIAISDAVRAKLDAGKEVAQLAAKGNAVHCPDWLGAQVLLHGTRGGMGT